MVRVVVTNPQSASRTAPLEKEPGGYASSKDADSKGGGTRQRDGGFIQPPFSVSWQRISFARDVTLSGTPANAATSIP